MKHAFLILLTLAIQSAMGLELAFTVDKSRSWLLIDKSQAKFSHPMWSKVIKREKCSEFLIQQFERELARELEFPKKHREIGVSPPEHGLIFA